MKNYVELMNELYSVSKEILPYYDIDKVKDYSVYIWTKAEDESENVFDIQADKIIFYEKHQIPEEVMPIIKKIQNKLMELEEFKCKINQTKNQ